MSTHYQLLSGSGKGGGALHERGRGGGGGVVSVRERQWTCEMIRNICRINNKYWSKKGFDYICGAISYNVVCY